jgi:hypothetical protein
MKDATATLDARAAALRKELDDYKALIAADYTAAGRPIPADLLTSPEHYLDSPKPQALDALAQKYRDMAKEVSEPDLVAHYMKQAEAHEGGRRICAARLRLAG